MGKLRNLSCFTFLYLEMKDNQIFSTCVLILISSSRSLHSSSLRSAPNVHKKCVIKLKLNVEYLKIVARLLDTGCSQIGQLTALHDMKIKEKIYSVKIQIKK